MKKMGGLVKKSINVIQNEPDYKRNVVAQMYFKITKFKIGIFLESD